MLEGLKLKVPKKREIKEEKKSKGLIFNLEKRVNGVVKSIEWLEDKTVNELADLWKIGHIQLKMSEEDQRKFEDIKYYLKNKFGVKV